MRTAVYVCLQATRQGQASYAHVHEIIRGLKVRDWNVSLFEPSYASSTAHIGVVQKLAQFVVVQMKCAAAVARCDAVYVRDHPLVLPTVLFARTLGTPVVLEVNGPYDELALSFPRLAWAVPVFGLLFRARARAASAVIAVTPQLRDWMIDRGVQESKIVVIGNAADPHRFTPSVHDAQRPYAIFFGALAVWQGIDTIIAAAQRASWPSGVELWIAGGGAKVDLVLDASRESPQVNYLGSIGYADIPPIVAGAIASLIVKNDLGDRTSSGLSPLKLFESMAAGVPVVVSDMPGLRDVVLGEACGLVVPVGDPAAICDAVAWLAENPSEAAEMGMRGRSAVLRSYSWDAASASTACVLDSVSKATGANGVK